MTFSEEDYPGLYQAANETSQRAQAAYLLTTGSYLFLTILGVAVSLEAASRLSALAAAALFLAGLGLTLLQFIRRFDRVWYNGRAVAESVKTRTWRFMMRAEPYGDGGDQLAERKFVSDLAEILKENRGLASDLGAEATSLAAISEKMEKVRAQSFEARLERFVKDRVDEQRRWYTRKQRENRQLGKRWIIAIITLHSAVVLLLLVRIGYPQLADFPIEFLAVVATAAVAWLHVKRYQDNSTAYVLAAHEITIIREQSAWVEDDESLARFVLSAEAAFSREHTQWVARRNE